MTAYMSKSWRTIFARSGQDTSGIKAKGVLTWVSAEQSVQAEVKLYDRLFKSENPGLADDFLQELNPESLTVLSNARLEPAVKNLSVGETVQFERLGYFAIDPDTKSDHLIFNRTVTLRDNWASKK